MTWPSKDSSLLQHGKIGKQYEGGEHLIDLIMISIESSLTLILLHSLAAHAQVQACVRLAVVRNSCWSYLRIVLQACSYMPESGVVDATTWKALLGPDATPDSLTSLTNEFEDDLTDDHDSIWLLGEQRWERRKKTA